VHHAVGLDDVTACRRDDNLTTDLCRDLTGQDVGDLIDVGMHVGSNELARRDQPLDDAETTARQVAAADLLHHRRVD
jgi:hypothetical protein